MPTPKFEHIQVRVNLTGPDGNAFIILGKVIRALTKAGVNATDIETYAKAAMAGDYENLLRVSRETVDFDGR